MKNSSAPPSGAPEYTPDLGELPKFEALTAWFTKLQKWCEAAQDEFEKVDGKLELQKEGYEEKIDKLDAEIGELQGAEDTLQTLYEYMRDVKRGIRDIEELYDLVPEP